MPAAGSVVPPSAGAAGAPPSFSTSPPRQGYGNSNDLYQRLLSTGAEPAGASALLLGKPRTEVRQFEMDKVCGPECTQAQVRPARQCKPPTGRSVSRPKGSETPTGHR